MIEYSIERSQELFERIGNSIAGGESSYARLRAGIEMCIDHTAGTRIWDVDGNEYIDYCLGFGPLIFGHSPKDVVQAVVDQISTKGFHFSFPHELDYKVGEAMQRLVPSVDLIRFTCSGTESTMAAIRLARAYTGKDKIIKFEGAYHGWSDLHFVSYHPALTMAAGRHNAPRGLPDSTGMPQVFVDQLIIQPFNDLFLAFQTFIFRVHAKMEIGDKEYFFLFSQVSDWFVQQSLYIPVEVNPVVVLSHDLALPVDQKSSRQFVQIIYSSHRGFRIT